MEIITTIGIFINLIKSKPQKQTLNLQPIFSTTFFFFAVILTSSRKKIISTDRRLLADIRMFSDFDDH